MTLVTNYGQLKQWVQNRLMDADLGSDIDACVRDGHDMLMRELSDLLDMTVTTTLTINATTIAIPSDLDHVVSFYLDNQDKTKIIEQSSRQIDQWRQSTIFDQPLYYAREGNNFQFPDFYGEQNAVLVYKAKFDFFASDADTNWLLTNHPGAYKYASLTYASDYIDDMEVDTKAERKANQIIESLKSWNAARSNPHMGQLTPVTRATP